MPPQLMQFIVEHWNPGLVIIGVITIIIIMMIVLVGKPIHIHQITIQYIRKK